MGIDEIVRLAILLSCYDVYPISSIIQWKAEFKNLKSSQLWTVALMQQIESVVNLAISTTYSFFILYLHQDIVFCRDVFLSLKFSLFLVKCDSFLSTNFLDFLLLKRLKDE
jgi:hypothetical protein